MRRLPDMGRQVPASGTTSRGRQRVTGRIVPAGIPLNFKGLYSLAYWHRADRGVTTVSDVVSSWTDGSGAGRTVTQSNAARRPAVNASAVGSRPSILFDGVDDFLVSGAFSVAQPATVFLVMKMVTVQSAASNHDTVWSRAGNQFLLVDSTPRTILHGGSNVTYAAAIADGAWARVEFVINGASSSITVNDIEVATGDAGANAGGAITYGSLNNATTHSTNVEIAEAFEFSSLLPTDVRNSIRDYQRTWFDL